MTWQPPEPHMFAFQRGTPYQAYTLDQLLAVRREAIEECAKVCDTEWDGDSDTYAYANACKDCAAAIRELLETT